MPSASVGCLLSDKGYVGGMISGCSDPIKKSVFPFAMAPVSFVEFLHYCSYCRVGFVLVMHDAGKVLAYVFNRFQYFLFRRIRRLRLFYRLDGRGVGVVGRHFGWFCPAASAPTLSFSSSSLFLVFLSLFILSFCIRRSLSGLTHFW